MGAELDILESTGEVRNQRVTFNISRVEPRAMGVMSICRPERRGEGRGKPSCK